MFFFFLFCFNLFWIVFFFIFLYRINLVFLFLSLELLLIILNFLFIIFAIYYDDIFCLIFSVVMLSVATTETVIGLVLILNLYLNINFFIF